MSKKRLFKSIGFVVTVKSFSMFWVNFSVRVALIEDKSTLALRYLSKWHAKYKCHLFGKRIFKRSDNVKVKIMQITVVTLWRNWNNQEMKFKSIREIFFCFIWTLYSCQYDTMQYGETVMRTNCVATSFKVIPFKPNCLRNSIYPIKNYHLFSNINEKNHKKTKYLNKFPMKISMSCNQAECDVQREPQESIVNL